MPEHPVPPRHVAIIMDGNGRWAKERGMPRLKGHEEGAKSVRTALGFCRDNGIPYLTLYAFSVQNWVRPRPEINGLMRLLHTFLTRNEYELHENKVRFQAIGRLDDLPKRVRRELDRVTEATAHYPDWTITLALSYGGRAELVDATRKIAARVKAGELDPETIDEAMISGALYDPTLPDPDLLIRTSGELRLSNFLLWQVSYSEMYITDAYWPDFREEEFTRAIESYAGRQRRFGGVESIKAKGESATESGEPKRSRFFVGGRR